MSSTLKNWRLDMEKCLLEIERVESKNDNWLHVGSPTTTAIENLVRDMQNALKRGI